MAGAESPVKALAAAAGAGGLFLAFWLGLGVPLPFSVAAGAAGYGALWLVLRNAFVRPPEGALGDFVDLALAERTVERGRILAAGLRETAARFRAGDTLRPRLARLAEALDAIAKDVAADPKDAGTASVFLGVQGESAARIARLALDLETRGASREQLAEAREKISAAMDSLVDAHERLLAHLQEDNMAELQAELDVLEQSMGLDERLERELGGTGEEGRSPPAGIARGSR